MICACRHDSDDSLSQGLKDMSHYVKNGRHFCKMTSKRRIHWHDVFGNNVSGIYARQNLYIESTLKALRLLVSERDITLEMAAIL